ncbi:hypothetical protein Tco_0958929 [Tanacetum coccineum]
MIGMTVYGNNAAKIELTLEQSQQVLKNNDVLVKTVVTVSQSTKVDSFPHVHAHSTKTIYLEAPVFKDKDFANSDLEAFKIEHSMKMLAKDT